MKILLFSVALLLAGSGFALSDEDSFRSALIELPPKYLGDIPLANRKTFIAEAGQGNARLDAASGWLHWSSDGGDVGGTSMIWAKELPRPDKLSLIFVHMAKPFADGRKPGKDQTFVLERVGKSWTDVTKTVMPTEVDLTHHFRTRKKDTVVEVATWTEFDRQDGRGKARGFGSRVLDLHWSGERFVAKKPGSEVLTNN